MKRLLYVSLSEAGWDAIIARARLEKRRPQDEAAVILERALGLLDPPPPLHELRPAAPAEEQAAERNNTGADHRA